MSIKIFEQLYTNYDEPKLDKVAIFMVNSLPVRSGGHVTLKEIKKDTHEKQLFAWWPLAGDAYSIFGKQ